MISFDIIADSVARIRNAQMAKHLKTELKFSKKTFALVKLLCALGYVKDFVVMDAAMQDVRYHYLNDTSYDIYHDKNKYDFTTNIAKLKLLVDLKYSLSHVTKKLEGVIQDMKLISKQGRRKFITAKDLKRSAYKNNMGSIIISTNKGLMSDRKAVQLNLGGEQILQIF